MPADHGGRVVIGLNAVIIAVTHEVPRVLVVRNPEASARRKPSPEGTRPALPFGLLDPLRDATLELALRHWVHEQTGLSLGYAEQLYTFGDRDRVPAEPWGGSRVISLAYLALVQEEKPSGSGGAVWIDWYHFFPWEDWRAGRPTALDKQVAPALKRWIQSARAGSVRRSRRERVDIAFGLGGAPWDTERVLERYELLYEAHLIPEAASDRSDRRQAGTDAAAPMEKGPIPGLGEPMAFDHRRMLASALGRLRGKLRYRPLVFELLPPEFTLFQLQRLVEALAGVRLHKQNFRRLVETGRLVESTGRMRTQTGGRPAALFRFRREVLRERPTPGLDLPGFR